jgi:uncharacterized membrane protein
VANNKIVPNIELVVVFAADVMSRYEVASGTAKFPEMVEIARRAYYDLVKMLISKGSGGIRLSEASEQFVEHLLHLLENERKGSMKVGPTILMANPKLSDELRKIPTTFNRLVEHFPYASGPNGLGS